MTTKVKICGITRLEDALHSAAAGADFLGYIFYAPSKRFIAPRSALEIVQQVRQQFPQVKHVGVFVDEEPANMAWVRNLAGLDYVQLHGKEAPSVCDELSALGMEVIKALGIDAAGARADFRDYPVSFYLCDTFDENLKGGTGRAFNLDLLPDDLPREKLFLAGGLNPENVGEYVAIARPYAVDVSTGVESSPGVKSHEQVTSFIRSVRSAEQSPSDERLPVK
jgi:phosphoribosylanthranilate isomerase